SNICSLLLSAERSLGSTRDSKISNITGSTSLSRCEECIQADPQCAWCLDPNFWFNCHTLETLRKGGCPERHIYNPQSSMQVAKNERVKVWNCFFFFFATNCVACYENDLQILIHSSFLACDEFSIQLRPGVPQSFPLNIFMPTDQPTDLTLDISDVPDGVNITLNSNAEFPFKSWHQLILSSQVHVEAAQCGVSTHNRTGPWSVLITPRGSSLSVKLEISLQCKPTKATTDLKKNLLSLGTCSCTENPEENSRFCSNVGALICGRCHCYDSYSGEVCNMQEDPDFSEEALCRSAANAPVCSSRGTCIGGYCECNRRENPKEKYSGKFCECDNFNCPYHNGRICGGHGKCVCGQCQCEVNWLGDDCSCSSEMASCMGENQDICSGKGLCQCGTCECYPPFRGPTCEDIAH
uniref:Integrin beta n=1 Tax=Oryzias latipes TaxID=8090 RepID=A0A3P9LKM0_ORYLA